MDMHDLTRKLNENNGAKIVLLVADGLGGLPLEPGGKTELETARTPNLDELARRGVCGLSTPVLPGITPGSGPGHLGLFGYDPLEYDIGRGILEALGIDFPVSRQDVAIRGNFCTIDSAGKITDRRAGRISTERCVALCAKLRQVKVSGVEVFVEPVREHRFVVVFRGEGLGDAVEDTDPQETGVEPREPKASEPGSERTAAIAAEFLRGAGKLLADEHPANMCTLRGFARFPQIPTMREVYGLNPLAIAVYPMYRGLAKLVGMHVADAGRELADQMRVLEREWNQYDFFFIHFKYTDSTGEDGDFAGKVRMIEKLDGEVPKITALKPDVLVVTGDHSTPSLLKSHSWHPVPTLLVARSCRTDAVTSFGESQCRQGGLGDFFAKDILPLALAHAGRLKKFGA